MADVPTGGVIPDGTRSFVVQVGIESAAPGDMSLWSADQPGPSGSQVSFSSGSSSSTTLVQADSLGHISVRSSVEARVSVVVVGVIRGTAASVGAGGTVVVPAAGLIDSATGRGGDVPNPGAVSTVPVTGLAGVPATGVRAVWLSVQGRAAGGASLAFTGPAGALPSDSSIPLSTTWSSSLVPAPVDDDGTVAYTVRGSAASDLRMTVVGWVADAAAAGAALPAADGLVPLPSRVLTVSAAPSWAAVRRIHVDGPEVPAAASGVLVRMSTHAGWLPGPFRAGYSVPGACFRRTESVPAEAGARTSATLVVPLDLGRGAELVTPVGSTLDEVVLLGYVVGPVSWWRDFVPPTLEVTSPSVEQSLQQAQSPEVVVTGTAADVGSGVRDVRAAVDGEVIGAAAIRAGSGATQAWSLSIPAVAGTTRLSVVATDWAGRTTTVTRQFTVVPASLADVVVNTDVHVLTDAERSSVVAVGAEQVVIEGTAPVRAGDVLVSEATAGAPEGLLRRVVAVERTGSASVVRTVPGALTDVFAQAHVDVEDQAVADQQPGPVLVDDGTAAQPRASTLMLGSLLSTSASHKETLASAKVSTPGKELVAQISASATLSVTFRLDIDLHIGWGGIEPELSEFTFALNTRGGIDVDITAQKEWTTTLERQLGSMRIGSSVFMVGPVPLELTYSLDPSVYLDAKVGGALTATYELSMSTSNGVTYSDGHWQVINERNFTAAPGAEAHITAEASAGVILDFVVKVYDLAGPYVGLKVGPVVNVDLDLMALTCTETLSIDYGLRVGARVAVLDRTLVDWNKDVATWTAVLSTKTYAYENPGTGGGTTDPGTGGGTTDPGTGGGTADPGTGGGTTDPGTGGGAGGNEPSGGRDVVLVVDISNPAGPELERERRAAHAVVDALRPGDRVAVVAYSGNYSPTADLTTDFQSAHAQIDACYDSPPTTPRYPMLGDALSMSIHLLADTGSARQSRSVIAFSDGGGWSSTDDGTMALARSLDIPVDGVGFEPLLLGSQVARIADELGGWYLTIGAGEDPVPAIGAYMRSLGGTSSGIEATGKVVEVATQVSRTERVDIQLGQMPAGTASGADGARVACTPTESPLPADQSAQSNELSMASTYAGAGLWHLDWVGALDPMAYQSRVYLCTVNALDGAGTVLSTQTLRLVDTDGTRLQGTWTPVTDQGVELALTSWPIGTQSVNITCTASQVLLDGVPGAGTVPSGSIDATSSDVPAPGGTWRLAVPVARGYAYRCDVAAWATATWRGSPENVVLGQESMVVDVP